MGVFDDHLVADALFNVVEVGDILLFDEFADGFVGNGGFFGFGRRAVIQGDHDFPRIPDFFDADLSELFDDQPGIVVRHGQIGLYKYNFAGNCDRFPGFKS